VRAPGRARRTPPGGWCERFDTRRSTSTATCGAAANGQAENQRTEITKWAIESAFSSDVIVPCSE
jgi:hypothetical protein